MDNQLYQEFLNETWKFFPKKSEMVNTLSDLLRIEKGAVYRRLRQEVPFTFNEIAVIARHLKISLDHLMGIEIQKRIPFELRLPDFLAPQEEDYYILDLFLEFIRSMNQSENSETASSNSLLPQNLYIGFNNLVSFYCFKWNYHYNNEKVSPFHQISIPPRITQFMVEYAMEMKKFNKTSFIFDSRIFRLLINDIIYFHSIRLIEQEDVLKIKEDLFSLLDYLEEMAITGQFKETGASVNLYISDIEVTENYAYLETNNIYFSMVKTFILSYVTSFDENTFERMKKWIHSKIKVSTLITLTNEKQRVLFFEEQRKITDELSDKVFSV
jgi:hypothetical protein